MQIRNSSKHIVIAEDAEEAKTFSEKMTGLLNMQEPRAFVFKTRWGVHTIGMKFSIDCVVCDVHSRVVAVRNHLKPGHFFFWNPRHSVVIELPAGTLERTKTEVGDMLEFS